MKTILNKTRRPIKVPLAGGKVLYLGPWRTGQIADRAYAAPAVKRLVDAGEIEVVGEGGQAAAAAEQGGVAPEATQGHPPETMGHRRGNR